jgi:hypothetical protein
MLMFDMRTAVTASQNLVRAIGVLMIILGGLFWTGNALTLIPIHMLLGILLVLLLWSLAFMAARNDVHPGVVALAVVWGLVVPVLGMTQDALLVGPLHWLIQVLHLLVGLTAIGLAETLARRASAHLAGARAVTAAVST